VGVAANCDASMPASRVAVVDGDNPSAPYVADAAIGTVVNLGEVCVGHSGPAPVGFTLILDSRILNDGMHDLTFVAEFPDGSMTSTLVDMVVANVLPYEQQESGSME